MRSDEAGILALILAVVLVDLAQFANNVRMSSCIAPGKRANQFWFYEPLCKLRTKPSLDLRHKGRVRSPVAARWNSKRVACLFCDAR